MSQQKELQVVARVRTELFNEQAWAAYRVEPTNFTRRRSLTLPRVATLILRGHKVSQQNALNKFFRELDQVEDLTTASAYSQARQKLRPELFVRLNQVTHDEYRTLCEADGSWRQWRGHRLLGGDGTKLNLPDNAELRQSFSVISNQHGAAGTCVQALGVVLYDLLNDLGVAAHLGPLAAEQDVLLLELWQHTQAGDVLVLDRNFADYAVIAWAVASGRSVVIRCPQQSFGAVNAFWASTEAEKIVSLSVTRRQAAFVHTHGLPETVQVRLLRFTLPTGETEVLLTTLCDTLQYPCAEFYQVYGWRWNQEVYYDRLKNIFEVERFSGLNERAIQQDWYGVIFLMTLESVLAQGVQQALTARAQARQAPSVPQVNRAVSYTSLLDTTVALLADPQVPLAQVLQQLHRLLQTNPIYPRPDRAPPPRKERSLARSLRQQRYRKRLTS
ncbi:MAG: IS4 family transposase [Acidobacteria bacterium]|nr:IS4 family transposase [Acidobacteriota bacterium]